VLRAAGGSAMASERTVESHLAAAYRKLGVRSRTELAEVLGEIYLRPAGAGSLGALIDH
jgi:Bacterial regulatory proteins, luxR family